MDSNAFKTSRNPSPTSSCSSPVEQLTDSTLTASLSLTDGRPKLSEENDESNNMDTGGVIEEGSCTSFGMSTSSKSTQKNTHEVQEKETPQNNWTTLEKSMALRGLKLYGLSNKKCIAEMVLTKDENEVRKFLSTSLKKVQAQDKMLKKRTYYYSKRRQSKMSLLQEKKETAKPLEKRERMALQINNIKSCMLKSGKDELLADNTQAALSRTLLLISRFENHPHPNVCSEVSFSAAYAFLSKLVTGQFLASKAELPNDQTKRYIRSCFQKLVDIVPNEGIFNK